MLTIDKYLCPSSLEEAYEAAQKKNSVVLGGMLWLRLAMSGKVLLCCR